MNGFRKITAIGLLAFAAPAHAAMTEWKDLGGGKARLIAVEDPASQKIIGALEIELEDGWKTYWRQPGDSGIPPQLDFSRSQSFAAGDVKIPAPQILSAGGAQFAGYKGRTTFIFEGRPMGADGAIRLDLFAGVCQEICIPAQASFEIPLSALNVSDPRSQTAIAMAREGLPREARPGFSVAKASRNGDWSLEIAAELPEGSKPEIFVEGPEGWYFPQAELVSMDSGKAFFRVGAPERPKGAGDPARLRFTLTDGGAAVEQWLTLGK